MCVVQEDNDRPALCEVREHDSQAREEAKPGRLAIHGPMHGGDATEQCCKVVEEAAAELRDLVWRQSAKVTLERLRPEAQRRRFSQRVGACGETEYRGS